MSPDSPRPPHPGIAAVVPTPVYQPPAFATGFLGTLTRVHYYSDMLGDDAPLEARTVTPSHPAFDEEYFEWTDLFDALAESGPDFVMVEAGAGYGRWLVRGGLAARLQNRRFHGVAIEGEPSHFRWLCEHCRDNGLNPADLDLVWGAVAPQPGFAPFLVGRASAYYGHAVTKQASNPFPDARQRRRLKARSILGRPPAGSSEDSSSLWIPAVTLQDLLAPYRRVDLVDFDVQGLELSVVTSALDLLDDRVRRLHIGTHTAEIEDGLRSLLRQRGWEKVHDYPCQTVTATPYGDIQFGDGVQTWLNPALAPRSGGHTLSPLMAHDTSPRATAVRFGLGWSRLEATVAKLERRVQELKTRLHQVRDKNTRLKAKLQRAREGQPESPGD